jgi:hypothetical protein
MHDQVIICKAMLDEAAVCFPAEGIDAEEHLFYNGDRTREQGREGE